MSTPYQPSYDSWTHEQNACCSIIRTLRAEDEKKGIDFLTEVSLFCGKQKERRAVSEEMCSRRAHSYVKYTKFDKCLHVTCVYTSVSCTARSSLNVPSLTGGCRTAVASCV